MERANIIMDHWIQETHYISGVASGPDEPNNFNEAWNHQCLNERKNGEKQQQRIIYEVFGFLSAITAVLAQVCTSTAGHMSANTAVSAQDPQAHIL